MFLDGIANIREAPRTPWTREEEEVENRPAGPWVEALVNPS
jgi:hypothetical protein